MRVATFAGFIAFRIAQTIILLVGLGCLGYGGYRLYDAVRFAATSAPVAGEVVAVRESRERWDSGDRAVHRHESTTVQTPVVRFRSPVDGRLHRAVSPFTYDGEKFRVGAFVPARASTRDPEDGRHDDVFSWFVVPVLLVLIGLLGTVLPVLFWHLADERFGLDDREGMSLFRWVTWKKTAVALASVAALTVAARLGAPWLGRRALFLLLIDGAAAMRVEAPPPGRLLSSSEAGIAKLPLVGADAATHAVLSAIEEGRREDLRRYLAAHRDPVVRFPIEVKRVRYFTAAVGAGDADALRTLADAGVDVRQDPWALGAAVEAGRSPMLRTLAAMGAAPADPVARARLVTAALDRNDDEVLLALVELGWVDRAQTFPGRVYGGPERGTTLDVALVDGLPRSARALEARGLVPASPLLARLVAGDLAAMRALLPDSEWPRARLFDAPLLSYAARAGHAAIVRRLLELGADAGAVATLDWRGRDLTALDEAVRRGHVEVVRLLAAAPGAKAWLDPADRTPPICDASKRGRWDLVRVLVDAGATPDVRCSWAHDQDATPLHRAVADGNLEMVEYLLARGADPLAQGDEKLLPVELARSDAVRAALERAGGRRR